jgi:murein L,D-transpeptidase YcbB/YkuD
LNPYWNVPELIAKRDLMPRILRDPKYLARQRIRVLRGYGQHEQELDSGSIDWSSYRNATELPFRFRQDPGVSNSMGQIKFVLPNPFAILLHDTPSKHLFNQSVRAYSSGCIRVEDPLALADYVMGDAWQQDDFREIMDNRQSALLTLPRPIPVHMLYMTAWAKPNGTVQFRQDVYGRDGPLLAAIRKTGQLESVEKVDTGQNKVETLARISHREARNTGLDTSGANRPLQQR